MENITELAEQVDAKPEEITRLLHAWQRGDRQAADALMPLIFGELHKIASAYLRRERADHTYQPTALVNEAFLRLVDQRQRWHTRSHFFGIAAQLIRRILIDHARRTVAARRGGREFQRVPLDDAHGLTLQEPEDLIALDHALEALKRRDPLKATVVEYRFFGGLTAEEIAEVMGVAPITVHRHWQVARAFLYRELTPAADAATRDGLA